MRVLLILTGLFCVVSTQAQSCPPVQDAYGPGVAVASSSLHGTLRYHDELREWLGLRFDKLTCGQYEVQLTFSDAAMQRRAESFRGCGVTVTGTMFYRPSGYYSAEIAINDPVLRPDKSCHPLPIRPDPASIRIDPLLRNYRASITLDYRKGRAQVAVWTGEDRRWSLEPWQAYVHYTLNSFGDGIWFSCVQGFRLGKEISQDPPPKPSGMPMRDKPDAASTLLDNEGRNTLTFSCEIGANSNQ